MFYFCDQYLVTVIYKIMEKTIKNPDQTKNKVRLIIPFKLLAIFKVEDCYGKKYGFHYDVTNHTLLVVDCELCEEFIIHYV